MKVREVQLDDLEDVSKIMQGAAWKSFTPKRWKRDWDLNPTVPVDQSTVGHGWVLEDDGRIVGFIGNLIQSFQWQGRILRSACAWGYVVSPEARGNSMRLVMAFARQRDVDILMVTTATVRVPEIFQTLKFERLPQADFDIGLYWVIGARGLITATLRKYGAPKPLAILGGAVLGPVLAIEKLLSRRWPKQPAAEGTKVEALTPEQIGPDFDELWRRKCGESPRLGGVRSAEILRWHFATEWHALPPVVLAATVHAELRGYAILIRHDKDDNGLTRFQIADMLILEDDPAIVRALLHAAHAHAVAEHVDMLELVGHPEAIRRVARESRPRPWRKPAWPYLYKVTDPDLKALLRSADHWYPTLLDGDGSLFAVDPERR